MKKSEFLNIYNRNKGRFVSPRSAVMMCIPWNSHYRYFWYRYRYRYSITCWNCYHYRYIIVTVTYWFNDVELRRVGSKLFKQKIIFYAELGNFRVL